MSAAEEVYDALLGRVGEANPRPRIEPVRRLAELAGSPQLSFPVVQIAGTNGKTSTSRAVESLLRAHGLRTGLFTSPHLVDFTERFQVDGSPIGGERLAEAWGELLLPLEVVDAELEAAGQGPITFFEALAVLAFTAFADAPVDVAVIEVGMGGEWDATNIVDAQVAVFTPIALDHTAILGPDIATIAQTKAGIIKPGSTVVSAAQDPAALTAIEAAAERTGSRVLVQGRDFRLAELAPLASRVILTTVDSPRAIDADRLAELAATALPGLPVEVEERLPDALDAARAWASTVEEGETRGVLVTGSVMLAGEAIAYSRDEGWGIA
ncbi:hypothetical protein BMH30_03835 [Leucobacter sp. OLES1]|nr:hypothetical protein BMH30_03835 [Leucobacter sp. OLES1]